MMINTFKIDLLNTTSYAAIKENLKAFSQHIQYTLVDLAAKIFIAKMFKKEGKM